MSSNKMSVCCPNCSNKFEVEKDLSKSDAHYPWDQCIADQLKRGYSQKDAARICGEIKAKSQGG